MMPVAPVRKNVRDQRFDKLAAYTLEELDRAIFEVLRLKVVATGYLPDVTAYPVTADFIAAKNAMRTAKGQLIEVDGVSSGVSKFAKSVSKIIILRTGVSQGSFGGGEGSKYFVHQPTGNKFNKRKYPQSTFKVSYEVRIVCDTVSMERILMQIVGETFEYGNILLRPATISGDTTDKRYCTANMRDAINVSASDLMEWMYKVDISDVFLSEGAVTSSDIVPMTEVTENIYPGFDDEVAPVTVVKKSTLTIDNTHITIDSDKVTIDQVTI